MHAGFFSRIKRALPALLVFPFRFLFFLVTRKKVYIRFFRTDTIYAFENIPVRLQWLVRNAFWVHLDGYGYVLHHRGWRIIAAGKEGDHFVLTARGFGGRVQQEVRISVVKMRPARPSAAISPLHSYPSLDKTGTVKVRSFPNASVKHTAPGLFNNDVREEIPAKLLEVFSAERKEELKNITI
ncbi:MAG TPA: hypothetical protein VI112_12965 [Bacteroidia bacterium]|jgi:hypothetical protein